MITHVAEAKENRGRVVLVSTHGRPQAAAVGMAIDIARAFNAAIAGVVVQDPQVADLARFGFVRTTSFVCGPSKPMDATGVASEQALLAASAQRELEIALRRAGVPYEMQTLRADPATAISVACRAFGPWNIVVFADVADETVHARLFADFGTLAPATAVVLAGPQARLGNGPVLLLLGDAEHAVPMLRTARQVSTAAARARKAGAPEPGERAIEILLLAADPQQRSEMEAHVRLTIGATGEGVRISRPDWSDRGSSADLGDAVRRRKPGLVLVADAGLRVHEPVALASAAFAADLPCPLLIMR